MEELARQRFSDIHFTLVEPSEKMLEQAKKKLNDDSIQYICSDSASIHFIDCFDIVTAIQSHHYMHEEERRKATECVYHSLKAKGIYISFENIIPEDNEVKIFELLRWENISKGMGKRKKKQRHIMPDVE